MSFKSIKQVLINIKKCLKGIFYPKMKNLNANLYAFVSFGEHTFYFFDLLLYLLIYVVKIPRKKVIHTGLGDEGDHFSFWGELSL